MIKQLSKWIGIALLGISPVGASISIYMPPEHLARRADLVVEARVIRTASGYDPSTGTLGTYVTLQVDRTHRGPRDLRRLVIREPGGRHADLVHAVDAVPVYTVGERVLAFLEARADGSLRTTGMFYGKFRIEDPGSGGLVAVRDLDGQGTILRGPALQVERMSLAELESTTAAVPRLRRASRARTGGWVPVPTGIDRMIWEDVVEAPRETAGFEASAAGARRAFATGSPSETAAARFVVAEPQAPARWEQSDSGTAVTFHIQRGGDPLGDAGAAVLELQRAMAAWSDVPESRLVVSPGSTDFDYTGSYAASPAAYFSEVNVVLFGDPYDDISDPVNCGGVLAIGGYWRSTTINPQPVNNVAFYAARQAYLIFNNGFECFLGDPENLAEVATHELGHGLGFGHSEETDAIMRSFAYGFRGPRLGDDDRDAAHCHYPHTIRITRPDGGEVWAAGSFQTIAWNSSAEHGPDPGVVDIEYSINGGADWAPIANGTPNDGAHTWQVPTTESSQTLVRILRYPRGDGVRAPYPASCSGDGSNGSFAVVELPPVAGAVPDGSSGPPLRVERAGAGQLRLSWGASCSASTDNYAVYEGSLSGLRDGNWDHEPVSCAGTDVVEFVNPAAGDRFFLVAPLAGTTEGDLGLSSSGALRPASASACGVRQDGQACEPPKRGRVFRVDSILSDRKAGPATGGTFYSHPFQP